MSERRGGSRRDSGNRSFGNRGGLKDVVSARVRDGPEGDWHELLAKNGDWKV